MKNIILANIYCVLTPTIFKNQESQIRKFLFYSLAYFHLIRRKISRSRCDSDSHPAIFPTRDTRDRVSEFTCVPSEEITRLCGERSSRDFLPRIPRVFPRRGPATISTEFETRFVRNNGPIRTLLRRIRIRRRLMEFAFEMLAGFSGGVRNVFTVHAPRDWIRRIEAIWSNDSYLSPRWSLHLCIL